MERSALIHKIDELCGALYGDVHLEGIIWQLALQGVRARVSSVQSPMLNLVGMADFTEDTVDAGIANVVAYQQEGKVFGWSVPPVARPTLGSLLAAGFAKFEEESMLGMVLRDLNIPIPINPQIRLESVSVAEWDANSSMMVDAYGMGMTKETVWALVRFFKSLGEQARMYLAYVPDRAEPVAFSAAYFDKEGEMVLLAGAATLEEFRGRGLYSTMVAKCLEDARAAGCTMAAIQAVKGTSAPICAKLGFEPVSEMDFYGYLATGNQSSSQRRH